MAKAGKRIRNAREGIDKEKSYSLDEALALIKGRAKTKFDETVDISMNLGVDPKHSDQMVRGSVAMPGGLGKEVRVAVFAKGDKAEAARKAGADIVGDDDLADLIQKGEINFDRCIASPDMMATVGKIGKILGPRGLMPNPKLGTVTPDVAKAVTEAKSGKVEFKVEKAGIVHAGIGKVSFPAEKLKENVLAFLAAINKAKPAASKGTYIKRITLSSTMGPGVRVDVVEAA